MPIRKVGFSTEVGAAGTEWMAQPFCLLMQGAAGEGEGLAPWGTSWKRWLASSGLGLWLKRRQSWNMVWEFQARS